MEQISPCLWWMHVANIPLFVVDAWSKYPLIYGGCMEQISPCLWWMHIANIPLFMVDAWSKYPLVYGGCMEQISPCLRWVHVANIPLFMVDAWSKYPLVYVKCMDQISPCFCLKRCSGESGTSFRGKVDKICTERLSREFSLFCVFGVFLLQVPYMNVTQNSFAIIILSWLEGQFIVPCFK